jgi:hypothetical protein
LTGVGNHDHGDPNVESTGKEELVGECNEGTELKGWPQRLLLSPSSSLEVDMLHIKACSSEELERKEDRDSGGEDGGPGSIFLQGFQILNHWTS